MKITIICIGIENNGNLGAIARSMKNFDFKNLLLIEPKCNPKECEAIIRAKHAKEILTKCKISDLSALDKFDHLVGTTSVIGTDYNIPRSPLTPEQLSQKIQELDEKSKVGLVFGPEGTGLSNELLKKMDFNISIPTSKNYAAMNLSHSISVILYELYKVIGKNKIASHIEMCNKKHKDILFNKINTIMNRLDFQTEEKKETQEITWRKIIGKSMPTKREAFVLMGFFNKLNDKIEKCNKQIKIKS